jgi:hypothetical protein
MPKIKKMEWKNYKNVIGPRKYNYFHPITFSLDPISRSRLK